jgi:DNA-directed RNA polymerase subunit K/omega
MPNKKLVKNEDKIINVSTNKLTKLSKDEQKKKKIVDDYDDDESEVEETESESDESFESDEEDDKEIAEEYDSDYNSDKESEKEDVNLEVEVEGDDDDDYNSEINTVANEGDIIFDECLAENDIIDEEEELELVPDSERVSFPKLSKYERVRILAIITKQLAMADPPFVKNIYGKSPAEIAEIELNYNMIPIKIKRQLPNNKYELWKLCELEKN